MSKEKTNLLEKAWMPAKWARVTEAEKKERDQALAERRFNEEPDDLVYYPEAKMELSRFGRAKGSVRQPMVSEYAEVDGSLHIVNRVKDGLDRMRETGAISPDELEAAREFQMAFRAAGYDRVKTTNLSGASGGGHGQEDHMTRTADARNRVHATAALVGGDGSPMWRAVFWIIGHGISIHDVVKRESGNRQVWLGFVKAALYLMGQDYKKRQKAKSSHKAAGKGKRNG